ncbi:MAG: C40 family peptidase [Spirochaetales bacterium]|nr:C40 family peptidase [Spirochaetales bacterium]
MKKIIFIQILAIIIVPGVFALDIYKEIIQPGQALVGTSYRNGGTTPSGFDCSGFITYLYKNYVSGLPRVSRNMAGFGTPVGRNSLIPGDLLFFATGSSPGSITHVALYIGQNSILHSISNGPARGVTITSLSARYWRSRYHSAVRVVSTSEAEGSGSASTAGANSDKKSFVENVQFSRGKYSGEVVNGEPEGKGTLMMNNGDKYEGNFSAGTFEGKGTYYWADGTSYSGEFHEGEIVEAAAAKGENYLLKKDSPWETWDGIVEGDFNLWLEKDKNAFEEWKKNN